MPRSTLKILIFFTLVFCFPLIWTQGIVGNFGDVYQYAAPYRNFSKINLQQGSFPLWNPYIFAGTPFLASPQSALFFPASMLFYFLPLNISFNLFAILHIFINSLGMCLLLTSLGRTRTASLFGGLLWSYSFFFLSKLASGHLIHLSGYSLFPFVTLFFLQTIYSNYDKKRWNIFNFVISLSLQFFSGHSQVWFHTIFLVSLLFIQKLWFSSKTEKNKLVQTGCTSILLFFLLSAIQFLPTFNYYLYSSRSHIRESSNIQTSYQFATSYSMRWHDLITLIFPKKFGSPLDHSYQDPEHPSVYFETNALYFGILPLLFALAGICLLIKKKKFLLPILAFLFLMLAMGKNSPGYSFIWKAFEFLRVPARFYFLLFFIFTLSGSFFWENFFKNKKTFVKIIFLSLIFLDLFSNGKNFIWSENSQEKLGKSQALEWLSNQNAKSIHNDPYQNRIFTNSSVPNPNKAIFFQLLNVNGYEAILQRSLLNYFFFSQGPNSIYTTGVDLINPNKNSFNLFGTKFLISVYPFNSNWPLKYNENNLFIYENPNPESSVRIYYKLSKFSDLNSLISTLDSPSFNPNTEILQYHSSLNENAHESLPKKNIKCFSFKRTSAKSFEIGLKTNEKSSCWLFLSEAFFPGWKVWGESGEQFLPFQIFGYFQGIKFNQNKLPVEKIFWLYQPKEFFLGAILSVLCLIFSIYFLCSTIKIGILRLYHK
ncbi:MAG: hypothetical protein HYT97_01040 [Elusimicrobia bacterium]|nr:hypothetical protein [Elusimicrobiota bacterium]